ncbi:hypothetical protein AVEN_55072-1 [Araneus ventricosus]|uniref:Uncharacterized protein n=1 Tax=Araneus ventricosus TaxID=182803 RepID=A0A4Y2GUH4_ARAVE|nr:hypothetical protein AVEN_55072-1 [Araneus ventricosus]
MALGHSTPSHFSAHPFRQVIHDRSTQRKSIHYHSVRSTTSPISSLNHVPQVVPPTNVPNPIGFDLRHGSPNGAEDIQPFTPH